MKLLPLSRRRDTYGCLAIGLLYEDSTSGTPADGHAPLTTVQHGKARGGFVRIADGVIPGEAGDRAIGMAITDTDTDMGMGMGTLTAIADSLSLRSRHAVVAMYSAA